MKKFFVLLLALALAPFSVAQWDAVLSGSYTAAGGAPTLSSASVDVTGNTLTLNWSASCTNGAGGSGGFSMSASGGAVTVTYSSGSGSSTYTCTLSRTINSGETLTVGYTQPGNGVEATVGGADVVTFSGAACTNNSTVGGSGPVVAHSSAANGAGTDTFTTAGFTSTTGNMFLVVFNSDPSSTVTSVTDSKLNTYTQVDSGTKQTHVWVCYNGTGGAGHTATVLCSTGAAVAGALIEISGANTVSAIEGYTENSDGSTPWQVSDSSFGPNRLMITLICTTNSSAGDNNFVASGWTNFANQIDWNTYYPFAVFSMSVASASSYPISVTDSSSHAIAVDLIMMAIKP